MFLHSDDVEAKDWDWLVVRSATVDVVVLVGLYVEGTLVDDILWENTVLVVNVVVGSIGVVVVVVVVFVVVVVGVVVGAVVVVGV